MPTNKELELQVRALEERIRKLEETPLGVISTEQSKGQLAPKDVFNLIVQNAQRNYHKVMKELIPPLLEKYNLTLDDFGVREVPIIPQSDVPIIAIENDAPSEEPIIKEETLAKIRKELDKELDVVLDTKTEVEDT